ncbi:hypothetical protein [Serratia rubidaea]|nr:hypothetical protein [Serratia rubidaea]MEB7583788.1 hypothetical protein [Serratia rubidaea]
MLIEFAEAGRWLYE